MKQSLSFGTPHLKAVILQNGLPCTNKTVHFPLGKIVPPHCLAVGAMLSLQAVCQAPTQDVHNSNTNNHGFLADGTLFNLFFLVDVMWCHSINCRLDYGSKSSTQVSSPACSCDQKPSPRVLYRCETLVTAANLASVCPSHLQVGTF